MPPLPLPVVPLEIAPPAPTPPPLIGLALAVVPAGPTTSVLDPPLPL
jgi:hypothetical protein